MKEKTKAKELTCLVFLLKTLRFLGFWHRKNDNVAYTIFGTLAWTWQFINIPMNLIGIYYKAHGWESISAAFEDLIMGFSSKSSINLWLLQYFVSPSLI